MVDRCVCYMKTFAEIKKQMEAMNLNDFDELRKRISFGLNCGLCIPYIRKMMATGRTEFSPDEADLNGKL